MRTSRNEPNQSNPSQPEIATHPSRHYGKKEHAPRLLTTQQAADAWGISRWRLYDLVREGQIRPVIGMGKGWKFLLSDFTSLELSRL